MSTPRRPSCVPRRGSTPAPSRPIPRRWLSPSLLPQPPCYEWETEQRVNSLLAHISWLRNVAVKTDQRQMRDIKELPWKGCKRIQVQLDEKKPRDSLDLNSHYLFEGNQKLGRVERTAFLDCITFPPMRQFPQDFPKHGIQHH